MKTATTLADLFGDEPVQLDSSRAKPDAVLPASPSEESRQLGVLRPSALWIGTSSWHFPGWAGLVYDRRVSEGVLAKSGLVALSGHPFINAAGIDRSFYAPVPQKDYARYAAQVHEAFRFIVKGPNAVTDAFVRDPRGRALMPNEHFLKSEPAIRDFIEPCVRGLGLKAGPLVFQFSPVGKGYTRDPDAFAERLHNFLRALPHEVAGVRPLYAVEVRDPELLVPSFVQVLKEHGARYCVGFHARMPSLKSQLPVLRALWPGPLVVRWTLHAGFGYNEAKAKYEPFDQLVDEDLPTREALADLISKVLGAGEKVYLTANNKAEGSAPLTLMKLLHALLERLKK